MSIRIGIVGVSGYGGSELLRLCIGHPTFEVVYASGESTVGQTLVQRFPALAGHGLAGLVIEPFVPEKLDRVDLLFASLPTGKSKEPMSRVPAATKVVDVGGDHRYAPGWVYGLTELPGQRAKIAATTRLANPGCYPAAALLALAPLVKEGLIEAEGIAIDAKSGVTGTGRGGASDFGYAETNEDFFAYGLAGHPHVPEIRRTLADLAGSPASVAFTPHLVPMTRGILATCYARPRGNVDAAKLYAAAEAAYRGEPFVKIVTPEKGRGPHTKWASGSNLIFLAYALNPDSGLVVAVAAIDNLGKGAAGQAVQNMNLAFGLPETQGLR